MPSIRSRHRRSLPVLSRRPARVAVSRPIRTGLAWVILGAAAVAACVPPPAGRVSPTIDPASTPAPTAVPTPIVPDPSPSFVRPTPTPRPTFLAYVVEAGDTLTAIARRFATTPQSIAFWNRSSYPSLDPDSSAYEPDRIRVGWTLLLIPDVEVSEEEMLAEPPSPSPLGSAAPAAGASPAVGGSPSR